MQQDYFHGILVNMAFTDKSFPIHFNLFAKKNAGDWTLYGVEISRDGLDQAITQIQTRMRDDAPFYAHLYDDQMLVVIFKNKVFKVTSHASSWEDIMLYGKGLNIPQEQLDFWPNRFQDEVHYFEPANFI